MSDDAPIVFVVDDDISARESPQSPAGFDHRKKKASTSRARLLLAAFYLFAAGWMTALDSLWALDTSKPISQYAHSSWRTDDGFYIGSPTTITQTVDGYLWIGTNLGLVRFDGVRFAQWQPPSGERLLDPRVFSLLGSRDGSLWIGTGYSLSRWRDGHLTNYPGISGRIESLLEDSAGAIWLARTQSTDGLGPVCRVKSEQVTCYSKTDQVPFPNVLQLAKSDDQAIWLAGYSELCRWKPGTSSIYFPNLTNRQEGFALFRSLATGPDGSTWAVIDHPGKWVSLQHFVHEQWHEQVFSDIPVKNSQVTSLFVDQKNGLWIGTSTQGVFRVQGDRTEHFGESDGLSSSSVQSIYQDGEGDVWVVTSVGIDNFRDRSVSSYSMREGLDADGAAAVLASRSGAVWVLSSYATVQKLENGRFSEFLPRPGMPVHHVTTLFEDHAGRMWFGLEGGLYVYDKEVFRPILHADGTPLGIVFSITEDTRQRIWVRAGSNLDRIDDFALREERTSPQISTAYILAATPDGGVILGLVDGELLKYRDGREQSISSNGSGSRTQIRDLLVDPDGTIWGTTLNELFSIRGSTRRNLNPSNGLPCDGIFALVEDDAKAIWLYSQCGLIRISRSDLNQWGQHPNTVLHPQLIDEGDGVQPGLTSLKPQASKAPDGRLWFVNGRILQTIDADHLKENLTPPLVHVEAARADLSEYSPTEGLHLPALTRDLEIDYTAISFVAPQKVRFRYILEGHDKGWQEPGTRRQAFYNDLGPGKYRFRVIACNNDGVWNETGAVFNFSILPAYYQTAWFRALCCAAFLLLVWVVYQFRLRQLEHEFNIGLEAQVNERTRIARDLHDTLLQTFHGLMFQFQAVRNLMPRRPDEAMRSLDDAINETENALTESRDAIKGLRAEPIANGELAELLRAMSQELMTSAATHQALADPDPPVFVLIEEGERRALTPTAKNETYRIAFEILRNAFNHAHARRIEVEIRYDSHMLRLRIRDDGRGIDPKVLKAGGRTGHWGLRGVRERAERIGAQLEFWSDAGAGTEVQLSVPAMVAYEAFPASFGSKLFRKVTNRGKHS